VSPRGRAREEVSAGGVVFRFAADDSGARRPVFLLIRDSYRNWGFPKGHLEDGEGPEGAALREVAEETGLGELAVTGAIETIDWYFRFRGRLIHKVCHFYLMQTERASTCPQRSEGITACRWVPFDEAVALVSYANAREVLRRAHAMVRALESTADDPGSPISDAQGTRDAAAPLSTIAGQGGGGSSWREGHADAVPTPPSRAARPPLAGPEPGAPR
jgi:8-oxo-dGTP pyrophosphatase MutT (NUDIX family)